MLFNSQAWNWEAVSTQISALLPRAIGLHRLSQCPPSLPSFAPPEVSAASVQPAETDSSVTSVHKDFILKLPRWIFFAVWMQGSLSHVRHSEHPHFNENWCLPKYTELFWYHCVIVCEIIGDCTLWCRFCEPVEQPGHFLSSYAAYRVYLTRDE